MGHNGLTGNVRDFNLEATEDRWGREALFVVLFPVTYVTGWLDVFIFNSIEFWSGENPVTGKTPALVDVQASALEQQGVLDVASAQLKFTRDRIQLDVIYEDGSYETLTAHKDGALLRFFRGDELVLELATEELHRAAARAHL